MLHHLERCSEDGATQIALGFPYATREAVGPTGEVTVTGNDLALVLGVGNDFCEFDLDVIRVFRLTTENGQRSASLIEFATLHEITRGFREEEETGGQNDTPCELNGNGNTILTGVSSRLGGVDHDGSEEDSDCNAELVTRNQSAAYFSWTDLGHVDDDG